MIEFATLITFITTCTIIELTPGPNMGYLAILSLSNGKRAGYATTLGIALGLLTVGIIAALGLAAIISNSPTLYQMLRWGGVAYMLYLAWDGWKAKAETSAGKAKSNEDQKHFTRGLIVNLLNPKAAVFYIAILPSFISPAAHILSQNIILTIIYVAIATFIHACIVTLAATLRPYLENEKNIKITRRILSLMLAGIAVWFAINTAR